jgi:hypothetical protein
MMKSLWCSWGSVTNRNRKVFPGLKGSDMSGLISRKPLVGFATSIIFGVLGMLLVQVDTAPDAPRGITLWLFRIVGSFLLFVALGSLVTAVYGVCEQRRQ